MDPGLLAFLDELARFREEHDAREPERYPRYLELELPKLPPGTLLVADNVISHIRELAEYLARVTSHPDLFSITVPIGKGEEISLKAR